MAKEKTKTLDLHADNDQVNCFDFLVALKIDKQLQMKVHNHQAENVSS